ncbi:MAG: hypothetical protein UR27_C0016G0003 [Candidatus Peregrinibacteria bacterium GW2011_GWA2_33_10]|nr:MAG: hypothetical protein UR27_C0016G0003 [Candidatus Peregrinibacteria bacterium GW2011_GWA2_33_10]KKP38491.1 MAG: hypothetical protein UR30_C0018G0018 [Candidatus Peregrinibacteria bacterium GW2011_GWC2_33_13]
MKTKIKTIWKTIYKYRNCLVMALLIAIILPEFAFAKETATEEFNKALTNIFRWILGILYPVVWLVIAFVGSLMDNTFILSADIEGVLRTVWTNVRNWVNLVFVLALVVIAIYNIVGKSDGNLALKTMLPKFVIALIAVNFSFFIGKLIIDANNIMTTAVFSIPSGKISHVDLSKIKCYKYYEKDSDVPQNDLILKEGEALKTPGPVPVKCKYPRYIYIALNKKIFTEESKKDADKTNDEKAKANETQLKVNDQLVLFANEEYFEGKRFDQNTFGVILAYNIFNIQNLIEVASQSQDLSGLTINAFFSIMFLLIYGTIFVAIALVLIGRAAVIWLCLALSPIVALLYALEGVVPAPGEFNIKDMFIKNAFAPLILSVPITLSFILINASIENGLNDPTSVSSGTLAAGPITVSIDSESAVKGMADARAILWNIAIVVLLWKGVQQAANGTIASGMVNTVMDSVKRAGVFVSKLPGYLPIIPGVTGDKTSIMGWKEALGDLGQWITSSKQEHAKNALPFLPQYQTGNQIQPTINTIRSAKDLKSLNKTIGHSSASGYFEDPSQSKILAQNIVEKWTELRRNDPNLASSQAYEYNKINDGLIKAGVKNPDDTIDQLVDNNPEIAGKAKNTLINAIAQNPSNFMSGSRIPKQTDKAIEEAEKAQRKGKSSEEITPEPAESLAAKVKNNPSAALTSSEDLNGALTEVISTQANNESLKLAAKLVKESPGVKTQVEALSPLTKGKIMHLSPEQTITILGNTANPGNPDQDNAKNLFTLLDTLINKPRDATAIKTAIQSVDGTINSQETANASTKKTALKTIITSSGIKPNISNIQDEDLKAILNELSE